MTSEEASAFVAEVRKSMEQYPDPVDDHDNLILALDIIGTLAQDQRQRGNEAVFADNLRQLAEQCAVVSRGELFRLKEDNAKLRTALEKIADMQCGLYNTDDTHQLIAREALEKK